MLGYESWVTSVLTTVSMCYVSKQKYFQLLRKQLFSRTTQLILTDYDHSMKPTLSRLSHLQSVYLVFKNRNTDSYCKKGFWRFTSDRASEYTLSKTWLLHFQLCSKCGLQMQTEFHYRSKWSEHVDSMRKKYIPNRSKLWFARHKKHWNTYANGIIKGDFSRDVTSYQDMLKIAHHMNIWTYFQS
jgi:hypothetical protein